MSTVTFDPARYWDARYAAGRGSGAGSRGVAARRKADAVNTLVHVHGLRSIVDWGCGDGQVLRLLTSDVDYVGVEVSRVMLRRLRRRFPDRRFMDARDAVDVTADLALSFDVLFHLPDDASYRRHLEQVFRSATRFVLVHATDHDGGRTSRHVRWRRWTSDIPAGWGVTSRPDDPEDIGLYRCERFGT